LSKNEEPVFFCSFAKRLTGIFFRRNLKILISQVSTLDFLTRQTVIDQIDQYDQASTKAQNACWIMALKILRITQWKFPYHSVEVFVSLSGKNLVLLSTQNQI
jgi:hypothetical protein